VPVSCRACAANWLFLPSTLYNPSVAGTPDQFTFSEGDHPRGTGLAGYCVQGAKHYDDMMQCYALVEERQKRARK
jgi:hypothetical protein